MFGGEKGTDPVNHAELVARLSTSIAKGGGGGGRRRKKKKKKPSGTKKSRLIGGGVYLSPASPGEAT